MNIIMLRKDVAADLTRDHRTRAVFADLGISSLNIDPIEVMEIDIDGAKRGGRGLAFMQGDAEDY